MLNGLNQATPAKFIEVWPTAYNVYPTLRMEMYGVHQGNCETPHKAFWNIATVTVTMEVTVTVIFIVTVTVTA